MGDFTLLNTTLVMFKLFSPALLFLLCSINSNAQQKNIGVKAAEHATHISRITNDSLVVVTGSTYIYSVDTHEDSGVVSTATTVKDLMNELVLTDATFRVFNNAGSQKHDGVLETGDRLVLANGDASRKYAIAVRPGALSGKLKLVKEAVTINTNTSVTLHFSAGQRTPNATVKIFIPAGINITGDNTTVNVIGRGAVKLNDLATQ